MILLHICCAPCGSASTEKLLCENSQVTLFFSNSNIFPYSEYLKRLESAKVLAKHFNIPIIEDNYNQEGWLEAVSGLENEPEKGKRCCACFAFSLTQTAAKAEKLGIEKFATSLTVSPHKNSQQIFQIGSQFERFSLYDFKKKDGFRRSLELTTEIGLYRQNYCGCRFSLCHMEKQKKLNCDSN